ncbi:hypothetical protein A1Q2_04547 [Trichosporon asahii var. asahii CBS 8904]|uniref:Uncharacterized protein n=1 Tax=Trichosporon asahii var. asahii (strain CBS 8904) TaxID=1220162 RepID=K1WHX8_TRIAC|nr:hypothetical protein A1Q2_04547 [Trichosporon asahii var. asahii CBS 8904]
MLLSLFIFAFGLCTAFVRATTIQLHPQYVGTTQPEAGLPPDWPNPANWPSPDDAHPPDGRGDPNSAIADWCDWNDRGFCFIASTKGVVADFNTYSDSKCEKQIDNFQLVARNLSDRFCTGVFVCYTIPKYPSVFYIKAGGGFDTGGTGAAVYAVRGSDCGSDIGSYTSIMNQYSGCIQVDNEKNNMHFKFFPCGNDGTNKGVKISGLNTPSYQIHDDGPIKDVNEIKQVHANKRAVPHCTGFDPDDDRSKWEFNAFTETVGLGAAAPCPNGTELCHATVEQGTSVTFELSTSTTVSAGLEGVASVAQSIGVGYSREATFAVSKEVSFSPGTTGYVGASRPAIQIPGWFTHCGNGWNYRGYVKIPQDKPPIAFPVYI